MVLLEDEEKTLDAVPIKGDDQILIELRNKDLTWPEEMSLLRKPQRSSSVFNQCEYNSLRLIVFSSH